MKLYIFKSETRTNLRAFSGESDGGKLPDRFRPWRAIGVVPPDRAPPHSFSRATIEKAIAHQGFQLWRLKSS
jgi:hypothetical protein